MEDQQKAFEIFQRVTAFNYPCLLERRQAKGQGDPAEYAVCVKATNFTGREVNEVLKLAVAENLDLGIIVNESKPYLILR